ncbi:hypothetical protein A7L03_19140 [Acinetobacter baumannii]|nr:hypothetical protein A7L51_18835 [Acinetobacter baumannii]OIC29055.1 hypothetical protein A7L30_19120 [Acinetobacter baumannii]OIC47790.1 hypothetical protein A7L03_19140 [Acinetobacter baumannii]
MSQDRQSNNLCSSSLLVVVAEEDLVGSTFLAEAAGTVHPEGDHIVEAGGSSYWPCVSEALTLE